MRVGRCDSRGDAAPRLERRAPSVPWRLQCVCDVYHAARAAGCHTVCDLLCSVSHQRACPPVFAAARVGQQVRWPRCSWGVSRWRCSLAPLAYLQARLRWRPWRMHVAAALPLIVISSGQAFVKCGKVLEVVTCVIHSCVGEGFGLAAAALRISCRRGRVQRGAHGAAGRCPGPRRPARGRGGTRVGAKWLPAAWAHCHGHESVWRHTLRLRLVPGVAVCAVAVRGGRCAHAREKTATHAPRASPPSSVAHCRSTTRARTSCDRCRRAAEAASREGLTARPGAAQAPGALQGGGAAHESAPNGCPRRGHTAMHMRVCGVTHSASDWCRGWLCERWQ